MRYVLDAGAVLAFVIEKSPVDELIERSSTLMSPDFVVAEVMNTCWKLARADAALPDIDALLTFLSNVVIVPTSSIIREAYALARRLDHPVYDCCYAALAESAGARLITNDRRFARKLTDLSFDVAVF